MQTIKDIEEELRLIEEPTSWLAELEEDPRAGVKKALARWARRYDKKQAKIEAYQQKKAFDASYEPFQNALVAGVDEAGRGPLAGPVVSAVVILPEDTNTLIGLDDSKALSKEARAQLAEKVREVAIAYAVDIQSAEVIDEVNIYAATKRSMENAVNALSVKPDFVITDAMPLNINCLTAAVIKADAQSLAVAAASILAKTTRDDLMEKVHEEFPMYNFAQNAGYGTAEHLAVLQSHGPCIHHRKTFEPIKTLINNHDKQFN